jgi:starch synthase
VLDCPALFVRDGGPYGDAAGRDWDDNWRRFAAFGRAGADLAGGVVPGLRPRPCPRLAGRDGPGLYPLRPGGPRVPSVMTIHNMAFQGAMARKSSPLGLPTQAWAIDGVEYHGGVGFLKAGMESADAITTVSPTYAREIRQPAFGMGLEGLIARQARVSASSTGSTPRCGTRKPIPRWSSRSRPARSPGAAPTSARSKPNSALIRMMARSSCASRA